MKKKKNLGDCNFSANQHKIINEKLKNLIYNNFFIQILSI